MGKEDFKLKDILQMCSIFMFVFLIKAFVIDIPEVKGISMYPTLNETKWNDRVVVNKIKHFINDYKREDVVVVKTNDRQKYIIKRIIGLPNDIVEIKNGQVYVNDNLLEESYLNPAVKTYPSLKVKVPENHVFVLGDNRPLSLDSRKLGTIPFKKIIGHANCRFNILELDANEI